MYISHRFPPYNHVQLQPSKTNDIDTTTAFVSHISDQFLKNVLIN